MPGKPKSKKKKSVRLTTHTRRRSKSGRKQIDSKESDNKGKSKRTTRTYKR